ncbi:MgtC/SapB family protein [Mesobaculum littorinae]|uniref:Protein MgtC n=1 Tax=Mesobaculum littorinae TaxID=2486419 RepID=A0A438ADP6_9RHOB|nr:MgtC/SapB family protein [Mesobaculum littorinae]RVV96788.1 MgtC/SapB family protein [Mesobaculum littorinae]
MTTPMWTYLTTPPRIGDALSFETIAVRLVLATVLCGLIGLERKLTKDTAGIRTNMLVGLATATFPILALSVVALGTTEGLDILRIDPVRVLEATATGVGFLGAGVVVFSKGTVTGLTTGASIWVSAAVGLAAGFGFLAISILAAMIALLALVVVRWLEMRAGLKGPD